jgi:hypothetical protein
VTDTTCEECCDTELLLKNFVKHNNALPDESRIKVARMDASQPKSLELLEAEGMT